MPLAHLDNPLNSELGKISSLEERHEAPTEDGYRVPGICSHYLFGREQKLCYRLTHWYGQMNSNQDKTSGRTYQSDFLHKRIPPFENGKEKLIALLRLGSFIIEFHHSGLEDPTQTLKLMLLKSFFILCVSMRALVGHKYLLPKLHRFTVFPRRPH